MTQTFICYLRRNGATAAQHRASRRSGRRPIESWAGAIGVLAKTQHEAIVAARTMVLGRGTRLPADLGKLVTTHRQWLVSALSVALTVATLYFVFRRIDRHAFAHLFWLQDRVWLFGAAILILLQTVLAGERWRSILATMAGGRPLPLLSVQAVYYSSMFFNSLPGGVLGGDIVRVWLARQFKLSVNQLVLSVLIDRVVVVAALFVLAVVSLPSIAHPLAITIWIGCATALVIGAAGFLLLQPIAHVLGRWRDLRVIHLILRALEQLRYVLRRGSLLATFWALLSSMCGILAAYCIAESLRIDVGVIAITAVISVVTFVSALPISVAGWGVREFSVVALLGLLGVDREAALLLSVEFGLLGMLTSLPGGAIGLAIRRNGATTTPVVQSELFPE